MRILYALMALIALTSAKPCQAITSYPPGTFSIDGIGVRCGNVPIILDSSIADVGMSGYGLIYLNPDRLEGLQTGLRLWWLGHECAHHFIGRSELAADCWSIRIGRDEGWFPPEMFVPMEKMFADNPGDSEHPSGPDRVRSMLSCYES